MQQLHARHLEIEFDLDLVGEHATVLCRRVLAIRVEHKHAVLTPDTVLVTNELAHLFSTRKVLGKRLDVGLTREAILAVKFVLGNEIGGGGTVGFDQQPITRQAKVGAADWH